MSKFENIHLAEAEEMSENELQLEIGKRTKYLRDTFGMEREECANFISGLLNMGVAMNKIFEQKKN